MADEVKTPFVQPPSHVPAGPVSVAETGEPYSPDNVVGDQLSEVKSAFEQPQRHVPAEPYTLASPPRPHVPAGVIGDVLSEVAPVPVIPTPHVPSGVIGDSLDEIQPAAPINKADPPADPVPIPEPPRTVPAVHDVPFEQPSRHVPPNQFLVPISQPLGALERDYNQFPEPEPYAPSGQSPAFDFQATIERLRRTDSALANFLLDVGVDPFAIAPGGPGSHALNPELYARWLVDLGKSIGRSWFLRFFAEQGILHALNDETSRVFDPLYFVKRAPILNGITREVLDPQTHTDVALVRDEIDRAVASAAMQGAIPTPLPLPGGLGAHPLSRLPERNVSTPSAPYSEGADVTIRGLVDSALTGEAVSDDLAAARAGDAATQDEFVGGVQLRTVLPSALFEPDPLRFDFRPKATVRNKVLAVRPDRGPLEQGAFPRGVIPAKLPGENDDSTVTTVGDQKPSDVIDDDAAYVPLSFTDMRPTNGNRFRTVFFRPFITSLNESLAPNWNEGAYFGRSDPVEVYQNTIRTISLGFELHAFAPEDLKVIYQKLHWLTALVYPEYGSDFLMKSGPVCRMRVGDVVKSGGQGLAGIIRSLDFDYTEALWELKRGYKVPRRVAVSLSFTVLHDGIVGLRDGQFGVTPVPQASTDPQEKSEIVVGAFRGFGEPVKEII